MAGRRETKTLKPIGKPIFGVGSESSGRNESERTLTSKIRSPRGRAHNGGAKAAWVAAILTDAASHSGGVEATAR
jgi:hypothetical protein